MAATLYLAAQVQPKAASQTYGFAMPFTLSPIGLQGRAGRATGRYRAWIYQLLLTISSNPLTVCACMPAASAESRRRRWLAGSDHAGDAPGWPRFTMLVPWIWLYDRQLWDNSLISACRQ